VELTGSSLPELSLLSCGTRPPQTDSPTSCCTDWAARRARLDPRRHAREARGPLYVREVGIFFLCFLFHLFLFFILSFQFFVFILFSFPFFSLYLRFFSLFSFSMLSIFLLIINFYIYIFFIYYLLSCFLILYLLCCFSFHVNFRVKCADGP
jgi:hypothetical protein